MNYLSIKRVYNQKSTKLTGSPGNRISGVQIFPFAIFELKLSSNNNCPLQTNPGTDTKDSDISQGNPSLGGLDAVGLDECIGGGAENTGSLANVSLEGVSLEDVSPADVSSTVCSGRLSEFIGFPASST